jgi:hypothetical protein
MCCGGSLIDRLDDVLAGGLTDAVEAGEPVRHRDAVEWAK